MGYMVGRLGLDQMAVYQIRVQGELDQDWVDWFDDGQRISSIVITIEPGVTTLTGKVADQPALYCLLMKIRDLSLALLSVNRLEPESCLA
jgi:hypothetical protein